LNKSHSLLFRTIVQSYNSRCRANCGCSVPQPTLDGASPTHSFQSMMLLLIKKFSVPLIIFCNFARAICIAVKLKYSKTRRLYNYLTCIVVLRPQWPRGLRHELSSPTRALGWWVRIPLKAWMSVCVYSVYVVCV
jgi:hypothetical protein